MIIDRINKGGKLPNGDKIIAINKMNDTHKLGTLGSLNEGYCVDLDKQGGFTSIAKLTSNSFVVSVSSQDHQNFTLAHYTVSDKGNLTLDKEQIFNKLNYGVRLLSTGENTFNLYINEPLQAPYATSNIYSYSGGYGNGNFSYGGQAFFSGTNTAIRRMIYKDSHKVILYHEYAEEITNSRAYINNNGALNELSKSNGYGDMALYSKDKICVIGNEKLSKFNLDNNLHAYIYDLNTNEKLDEKLNLKLVQTSGNIDDIKLFNIAKNKMILFVDKDYYIINIANDKITNITEKLGTLEDFNTSAIFRKLEDGIIQLIYNLMSYTYKLDNNKLVLLEQKGIGAFNYNGFYAPAYDEINNETLVFSFGDDKIKVGFNLKHPLMNEYNSKLQPAILLDNKKPLNQNIRVLKLSGTQEVGE